MIRELAEGLGGIRFQGGLAESVQGRGDRQRRVRLGLPLPQLVCVKGRRSGNPSKVPIEPVSGGMVRAGGIRAAIQVQVDQS
jgi:hypothetical protein